ncbi:MAG TPA: hypothetical protein VIH61_04555 [Waddliaceae bacterium]
MSIGYAIVDRLVRRKYSHYLEGFASPFYPSNYALTHTSGFEIIMGMTIPVDCTKLVPKNNGFEFWLLPPQEANTRWTQIRHYFENQQAHSKYTLFALEERQINIARGVKAAQSNTNVYIPCSPVQEHLKFLERFLEEAFPKHSGSLLTLEEKFTELWLNSEGRYLPVEIETLYFFAYYSWRTFFQKTATWSLFVNNRRVPLKKQKDEIWMPSLDNIDVSLQVNDDRHLQASLYINQRTTLIDPLRKKSRELSENKTQCLEYKRGSPPWNIQIYQQWSRIFSNPNLQISSLIQWVRNHISFLSYSDFQKGVEVALFTPGLLTQKIKQEPSTLTQLRELVREGMIYYGNHSPRSTTYMETCLFLVRMGVSVESYAPQPSLKALTVYEALLLEQLTGSNPSSIYYHLLYLYQLTLPRGQDSLRELIKAQFWLAYHESDKSLVPAWLLAETRSPLESYQEAIAHCFDDKEWMEQTFAEVFKLLLTEGSLPIEPCQGTYPVIEKGKYRMDVEEQGIFQDCRQLVYLKQNYRFCLSMITENGLVWSENGLLFSESGQSKIETSQEGVCLIAKKFPMLQEGDLQQQWFCKATIVSNFFSGSLLADGAYYDHWIYSEDYIVIHKRGNSQPQYVARRGDASTFCIFKVLPNGTLGHTLINIWENNHPLAPWFKRLGAQKEACVWMDRETGRIEEIEFLLLNLSFKQEEGRFRSQEYPDFFLAEEQTLEELDFFEGALILENGNQKCVVLPARGFDRHDENFSSKVTVKGPFFHDAFIIHDGFINSEGKFLYQLDEIAQILVHPDPNANFYLVLLFAMQRNYTKALFYLARSHDFDIYDEPPYWSGLLKLEDHSPEALAFYLRLTLHFIHNNKQVILSRYFISRETKWIMNGKVTEERDGLPKEFFKWSADKFARYLRLHSIKEVSRIPDSIRLTQEEELFLLHALKKGLAQDDQKNLDDYLGGGLIKALNQSAKALPQNLSAALDSGITALMPKLYWQKMFDVRLALLQHNKWSTRIFPTPYCICPSELAFQSWTDIDDIVSQHSSFSKPSTPLQDFVRLSDREMIIHFMTLYERAYNGKGKLDLFYLLRSGELKSRVHIAYGMVLNYVQKYPHEFTTLKFGDDPAVNQTVFAEVIAIVGRASAKAWEAAAVIKEVFFSQTVFFRYQKEVKLALAPLPTFPHSPWSNFSDKEIQALYDLREEVFIHFQTSWLKTSREAFFGPETPFAFASIKLEGESPTTQALVRRLRRGYKKLLNPKYGKTVYQLTPGKTTAHCLSEAKRLLEAKRNHSVEIKEKAEKCANDYPEIAYRLGLRKIGSDLPEVTMEGILTKAYQNKDTLIIKAANPSLEPKQIHELVSYTIQYHILRTQVHQLERAVAALEKGGSIQQFAEALACHGKFNPVEEPEIFLYQSRTGKTLRSQQADLLTWEISTTTDKSSGTRLFAIPAGEGKTTLYIPIAMKRSHRLGNVLFPVSSKPLYLVDREELKGTSQHIFAFGLDVLELALSTQANALNFQRFYEQLCNYQSMNGFKLTPEVYYALHLKYQLALENGNIESVRWLSQIFSFFATKGAALVDECRLNCSPLTQAKIGMGKPKPLPEIDIAVILGIYRALLSPTIYLPDGRSSKETLSLHLNQQATVSSKEREHIKEAIYAAFVKSPLLNIPLADQPAIVDYWLNKAAEPQWLKRVVGSDQARAIDLVKIYFDAFFGKAMKLIWRMQHVRSTRAGEEIHVPAHARQATGAYFEEVMITLIATIHGLIQQGLDETQVKNLMKELERRHAQEIGASNKVSEIEIAVGKWFGKEMFPLNRLAVAGLSGDKQFHQLVHKNLEAIFWYLEHILLKQIVYSPEQLSVTPIHFLNAFKSVTLFSADPGPEEIYGIFTKPKTKKEAKDYRLHIDPLFVAHAVHQFLAPANKQFLLFPFLTRPLDFFHSLLHQDPEIFSHLRMICDAGGMLRNFTVTEIVADFFKLLETNKEVKYDGIIIFEEASDKEAETELLLWLKEWPKPKEIKGHDMPRALQSLGLNWEKLKLLTVIDPSHRAGANIEQPKKSSVLVLLGEELTLSDDVQGKLRGRGVLKGDQWIIWGASLKLAKTISRDISAEECIKWEARNESTRINKETLLSAYQQIDYLIASPVWHEMNKLRDKPEAQIALWKTYRKGFVQQTAVDPIQRFKGKRNSVSTEELLWSYAEQKYTSFGYSNPWKETTAVHSRLTPIIAMAVKRQPKITSTSSFDAMRQTYVHAYQREEMKKESITNAHRDLDAETPLPLPHWLTIDTHDFVLTLSKNCHQASSLFNSQFLTPELWFTHNAIHTAKTGNTSLKEEYLKPIQYILIIKQNKTWHAFALADDDADFFQKQLIEIKEAKCQAALLSADGSLVQNGQKKCGLSEEELKTSFVQDVVIDVGLTHCELFHPHRFIERIEKWNDFWPMWTKIKQSQPASHTLSVRPIEKHVPAHIRKYVKPSAPANKSFLKSLFG